MPHHIICNNIGITLYTVCRYSKNMCLYPSVYDKESKPCMSECKSSVQLKMELLQQLPVNTGRKHAGKLFGKKGKQQTGRRG